MITYNHEKFIAQAVESVLMQKTTFPIELIIGEDCSTDGTRRIVQHYAKLRPDIVRSLLPLRNLGVHENLKSVLDACHGEYVALLEGDDYWTNPLKLQKQVQLLEAAKDCCMCAAKSEIWQITNGIDTYVQTLEGLPKDKITFLDFHEKTYLHTSTYMIKRSSLCEAFKWGDRIRISDTTLRYFLTDMSPCVFLPEVVSVYRITDSGIWTKLNDSEKLAQHIDLYESLYAHFKSKYRKTFAKRLMSYYWEQLMGKCKNVGISVPLKRIGKLSITHPQLMLLGLTSLMCKLARKALKYLRTGMPHIKTIDLHFICLLF